MNTVKVELGGETWDRLFKLHACNLTGLDQSLAAICEIHDQNRGAVLINLEACVHLGERQKRLLSPLLNTAKQARKLGYDFLVVSFS